MNTYTTYYAVFTHNSSPHIDFAPLRAPALFAKPSDAAVSVTLSAHATDHPTLPLPASPKSIYKLAHLFELEDLAKPRPNQLQFKVHGR